MATSRLMKKRASCKRGHANNNGSSAATAAITSLPRDMLLEVVARVAFDSFTDLHNLKQSCKDFLDASEDNYVLQHVSLDKFPLIPWFQNNKEASFLKRCKKSGNLESLYREGLRGYFGHSKGKRKTRVGGLESLKMAAQKGHKEAKYVYAMILLCCEDEELRKQGLEHLRFLRRSKCVMRCRKKVKRLTRCMWKIKGVLVRNQKPVCLCKSTCTGWRVKKGRWMLLDDDDDDYDNINMCEYCRWDHELEFFCQLFNVR